jgi:hypothetical protein
MIGEEFWAVKQKTDALVTMLGWSKDYCKRYIQAHYGCKSRLVMTDDQLHHLLASLRDLVARNRIAKSHRRNRNRRG